MVDEDMNIYMVDMDGRRRYKYVNMDGEWRYEYLYGGHGWWMKI